MFEKASKLKLRFSFKGNITTEDLWDLSINHLDEIYKGLSAIKKTSSSEDSLINNNSSSNTLNDLKIDIVKHIFALKVEEKNKKDLRAARLDQKRQLQAILANKQSEELQGKSIEELSKLINELDE